MILTNYDIRYFWDEDAQTVEPEYDIDINLQYVESCHEFGTVKSTRVEEIHHSRPWYKGGDQIEYKYIDDGEIHLYIWRMRSGKTYRFRERIDLETMQVS